MKKLLIALSVLSGIYGLGVVTHGRIYGMLMYLSLLGLGLAIAFLIPALTGWAIGSAYEKLDPDKERGMWIGSAIKGYGIYEGLLNVHSQLHQKDHNHRHRRRFY